MSKDIRNILIITFITVIAWIVLDIVHARNVREIPKEWQPLTTTLNPELNFDLVEELKKEKGGGY